MPSDEPRRNTVVDNRLRSLRLFGIFAWLYLVRMFDYRGQGVKDTKVVSHNIGWYSDQRWLTPMSLGGFNSAYAIAAVRRMAVVLSLAESEPPRQQHEYCQPLSDRKEGLTRVFQSVITLCVTTPPLFA